MRVRRLQWLIGTAAVALPFLAHLLYGFYPSSIVSLFFGWFILALVVASIILFFSRHALRMPALIGVAAALISYALPYFSDLAGSQLQGKGPFAYPLTVVTRNWLETNTNYEGFFSWLNAEKPDVVAIQELPPAFEQHYPEISKIYPYSTTPGAARDLIILSRYPIRRTLPVPIGDHFVLGVEIEAPGGLVRVYDLHPDTLIDTDRWANRNDYLEHVSSVIDTGRIPTLVVGDFNATAWEPRVAHLKSELALHEEPRFIPPTTRVLWRFASFYFGATIDHIYGNDQVQLSECHAIAQFGSDHRPVMCTAKYAITTSKIP